MPATPQRPKHIVHLLYRFAADGLENVIVQLVNGLPFKLYSAIYRLLRRLKPDLFHSCNAHQVIDLAESLHIKKYIQNHLVDHTK